MNAPSIPKLIVSHGGLASELLGAAREIAGEVPGLEALSLDWSTDQDIARQAIRDILEDLDEGHGVLLLTDLFGATPCNAACSVLEPGRFELVAGVNLPMVVRLACCPPDKTNVTELAEWLVTKGIESIRHVRGDDGAQAPAAPARLPDTAERPAHK